MPLRRTLRLGFGAAFLLGASAAVLAGLGSLRWYAMYQSRDGWYASVTQGAIVVCRPAPPRTKAPNRRVRPGWTLGDMPETAQYDPDWWFGVTRGAAGDWYVEVPVWAAALAIGLPGLLILRMGDGRGKTHCARCGYDLSGNVSGICPECGTPNHRPL